MSLFNVLSTSVSGMAAQSSKLGAVSDNIANANTTGYKRSSAEFSSMVEQLGADSFTSGGVQTGVRYSISEQGGFERTASPTDLAINGRGFFVVSDSAGTPLLTRAGAFVPDASGALVNSAGLKLMGQPITATSAPIVNGLAGLEVVTIDRAGLVAEPTSNVSLSANLPPGATVVAPANLPSANGAGATYSAKSSLLVYDNIGQEVLVDVYYTKTAANTWEVAVFDQAGAGAGGGFPYASAALATQTLTFDPSTGRLAGASPTALSLPVPNGQNVTVDMAGTSELAGGYQVLNVSVDGTAPTQLDRIEIETDGTLVSIYRNGARRETHRIPLADVVSPDRLTVIRGNAYSANNLSGAPIVAAANGSGMGSILSATLETSTVDLAAELTSMIEAQRGYSANSKSFQAGSDMLEVLLNLRA